MKKTFVLLLVLALGVWGYVVVQFLSGYFGNPFSPGSAASEAGGRALRAPQAVSAARPPLDSAFRDPFLSYLYVQKPAPPPAAKPPPKPALVVIEPPRAVLGGVLWGDAPVAILKQDAQTELVKEGGEAFGLKVVKIERHQVTVTKQGRKFVLGY